MVSGTRDTSQPMVSGTRDTSQPMVSGTRDTSQPMVSGTRDTSQPMVSGTRDTSQPMVSGTRDTSQPMVSGTHLIHCTNEMNVSIPQLADTLFERTANSSWVVVFKALIATHHLMMYGNEACQDGAADGGSAARWCPCYLTAAPSITVRAERNLAVKLESTDPENWGQ
ncbi:hypothetical protein NQZ68_028655 [Dissostichus eleginoides]|nr:hypothetical protein NQZ68_028655 [Dissostichus eleginoides]